MADTYEAFYNGKPLNPNRGLPTMTYAQAEDCGLTESERLWCCTDGEDTPITADDIPYDSNTSVKDKIDENIDLKTATSSTHQSAIIRYIQTGRIVTVYGTYTPQTSSTEEIKTTLPKPSAIFTVLFRTQSGNMGLIYFDNNGSLQQWNHTGTITAGQAVQFNFTYICI